MGTLLSNRVVPYPSFHIRIIRGQISTKESTAHGCMQIPRRNKLPSLPCSPLIRAESKQMRDLLGTIILTLQLLSRVMLLPKIYSAFITVLRILAVLFVTNSFWTKQCANKQAYVKNMQKKMQMTITLYLHIQLQEVPV